MVIRKAVKLHQSKKKRGRWLATIGALILVLTFGIKEVLMDNLKQSADSVQSAESLYRTETGQSNLWVENLALNETDRLKRIKEIVATQPEENRDYSDEIRHDLVVASEALGDLNSTVQNVSRFIDALPSSAGDLRRELDQLRPTIEKVNEQVTQTLKPSPKSDGMRAVEVEFAVVAVGLAEIPVAVLGDEVLTRADKVREASEKTYRFAQVASYCLYALSVVLGLFGVKGLSEAE